MQIYVNVMISIRDNYLFPLRSASVKSPTLFFAISNVRANDRTPNEAGAWKAEARANSKAISTMKRNSILLVAK